MSAIPCEQPHPARFDWLCAAAQLPGKTAHLAVLLCWLASEQGIPAVHPGRRCLRRFGISRDACYDGLKRLEEAKLAHVWRLPGRIPRVILMEPNGSLPLRVR